MATAAPSVGGAEGASVAPPPVAPASQEAEAKKVEVKARPIKDKPEKTRIPGLITRGDAAQLFGKVGRDERGKFTKMFGDGIEFDGEDDDDGVPDRAVSLPDAHEGMPGEIAPERPKTAAGEADEDAPKPAKPGEVAPIVEPPKPKVKFAGEEFEGLDQAEQKYKSLQGMFKPLKEKADAYERTLAEQREDRQAALEWTDVARKALAGTLNEQDAAKLRQQLGIQGTSARTSANPEPVASSLEDAIDMQMFEDLALHKEGGLRVAGDYLVGEVLKLVKEKMLPELHAKHEAALQPFVQDRAMQERTIALDGLLTQVGSYRLEGGALAFPELTTPEGIDAIAETMVAFGRSPDELTSPQGVIDAVARHRLAQSLKGSPTPNAGASGQGVVIPPPPASTAAASIGADNRGGGASPASPRIPAQHAAVLEAFDKAGNFDKALGFRRNPRVID